MEIYEEYEIDLDSLISDSYGEKEKYQDSLIQSLRVYEKIEKTPYIKEPKIRKDPYEDFYSRYELEMPRRTPEQLAAEFSFLREAVQNAHDAPTAAALPATAAAQQPATTPIDECEWVDV